jgi:hypothetical protein
MGGTVDPKTGNVIWTMHRPLDEQLAFYAAHPPACIAAFTCTPTHVLDFTFDGHGEPVNAIFELACPCGSKLFDAYAQTDPDPDADRDPDDSGLMPPVELVCASCETARVIFDPRIHGWNGVHNLAGEWNVDASLQDLYIDDLGARHHIIVRFEHGSETLGDAAFTGREQDVFSWISILAKDPESDDVELLLEHECA